MATDAHLQAAGSLLQDVFIMVAFFDMWREHEEAPIRMLQHMAAAGPSPSHGPMGSVLCDTALVLSDMAAC
jgi:hypothetical protein